MLQAEGWPSRGAYLISFPVILVIFSKGACQSSSVIAHKVVKLAVVLCIMCLWFVLFLGWSCWCCSCGWCSWRALQAAQAYM